MKKLTTAKLIEFLIYGVLLYFFWDTIIFTILAFVVFVYGYFLQMLWLVLGLLGLMLIAWPFVIIQKLFNKLWKNFTK